MTAYREELLERMIRLYGYEDPVVIQFAEMCENWDNNVWNNTSLTTLVKAHEESPLTTD